MDNQLRGLTTRKIEKILKHWGFKQTGQEGSHRDWEFRRKDGKLLAAVTTIASKKEYPRGTLISIIEQSGHSEADWVAALKEI